MGNPQIATVFLPLHYRPGQHRDANKINFSTFVTETNTLGNVRVIRNQNLYPENAEIFAEIVTKTNQTGEPEKLAAEVIAYLQERYDLA